MKTIYTIVLCFALAACSNKSGLDPSVTYSGFDNAKVVSIEPHGVACSNMTCLAIGAQWNASKPSKAVIVIGIYNDYSIIKSAELNIDGEKIMIDDARTLTGLSSFNAPMMSSTKGFAVDLDVIKKILASSRTWLRVHTVNGYIENPVIQPGEDSKAFHALDRFMKSVDA